MTRNTYLRSGHIFSDIFAPQILPYPRSDTGMQFIALQNPMSILTDYCLEVPEHYIHAYVSPSAAEN